MSHAAPPLNVEDASVPDGHGLRRVPVVAAAVGVLGIAGSLALASGSPRQFYFSWLTSFVFWLSIPLGGLFFAMLHHAARAGWSAVVRRLAENLATALPLFLVLFIPVAMGVEELYHWTHPHGDEILEAKTPYLNTTFFFVRAAIYLVLWAGLGLLFHRLSVKQDASDDAKPTLRAQALAPLGLILFALTVSFAAIDWLMSLAPHWYSTIFGVYYFAGSTMAIFATLATLAILLQRGGLLREVITVEHYHDLGKFLFAFVVFWAYIAFSQFLLIWYANMPEETQWYLARWGGTWTPITVFLGLGHFIIPFFFLMSRHIKRRRSTLLLGALWCLLLHWIDMYWLVHPARLAHHGGGHHGPSGPSLHLLDITTWLGIGGLVVAVLGWQLCRRPLVPVGDPRIEESRAFENI